MLQEVMDYYGLIRDVKNVGYFETEHHKHIKDSIKSAIRHGKMIALTGVVGCGKTTLLKKLHKELLSEKEVLVSKSLAVEKEKVSLNTLILALFYDLATGKDFKIPAQPERRERKLRELINKNQKPVALFVDEAHDLSDKTLIGFKRLIEVIQDGGGVLSVVLTGHPKLKNDLRGAAVEEIGSRTTVLSLDGMCGEKREFIDWILKKCSKPKIKLTSIITEDAVDFMAEKLSTPLQIEHHLSLALESGYSTGELPVTENIIKNILSEQLDDLEPNLMRNGYNVVLHPFCRRWKP